MRRISLTAIVLTLTTPALIGVGPVMAAPGDKPVCYRNKDKYDDTTRIVLNVKLHSRLFSKQAVYEADGKHSYIDNYKARMAVFDGAVVTSPGAKYVAKGAHLGGESYWVRGAPYPAAQGGPTSPIVWDCTSAEVSATPSVWYCTIGGGAGTQAYNLERLERPDALCSVFQNGVDYPPPPPPEY
jgi:hypothetical protein